MQAARLTGRRTRLHAAGSGGVCAFNKSAVEAFVIANVGADNHAHAAALAGARLGRQC